MQAYRYAMMKGQLPQAITTTLSELSNGGFMSRNGAAGFANRTVVDFSNLLINAGLAAASPVIAPMRGDTRYITVIPDINPCTGANDTPACRGQTGVGSGIGVVTVLLTPEAIASAARLSKLRAAAGLSAETTATINAVDNILPNMNTRALTGTEANALTTPNRGVIYVQENASMSPAARDFQAGCTGALCDVASGRGTAPALRYDNTVTNGNNYIRFDGIERTADGQGIILIDRKLKLADFNRGAIASTERTFQRVAEAVRQNPGYQVVYEFPNAAVAQRARNFINDRGLGNVIKVRP